MRTAGYTGVVVHKTPVKILIVDDKPANLLSLEAVLGRSDYALIRATSGAEAIGWVEHELFAAIILDVQMPDMDGYETAARIKRLPNGRDTPIIFVTAVFREDDDARRGYESGGLDYFSKPLDPELLKTKVQIYADLFRMTRQAVAHDRLLSAIAERQHAERALDKVLESVSEGVMIVDSTGSVTRTNHEAERIWGCVKERALRGKEDFIGWWVDSGKAVRPEDWVAQKALRTGKVEMNEPIAIQCLDGRSKFVLESASPLLDDEGRPVGAVVIVKEIGLGAIEELRARRGLRRHAPRPSQRPH